MPLLGSILSVYDSQRSLIAADMSDLVRLSHSSTPTTMRTSMQGPMQTSDIHDIFWKGLVVAILRLQMNWNTRSFQTFACWQGACRMSEEIWSFSLERLKRCSSKRMLWTSWKRFPQTTPALHDAERHRHGSESRPIRS